MKMSRARVFLPLLCALVVLAALVVPRASAGNGVWTSGGPEGGLVRVIAPSPNYANDGTVFSAGQSRGVLKSTDRGSTWTVNNTGMGTMDVRSIAISPAYAGDRTLFAASLDGGIFRSTDGGDTWTAINNGLGTNLVWALAISPQFASDRTIFAGTDDRGVFRSTNGGDTWVQVNSGITLTSFLAMAVSPNFASDRTVFAAAQGGLFKSTDGGSTWTWAGNGITRADLRSVVFSPAYASDGIVFVGTERGGVFKTTNRGQSWFDPSNGTGPADISGLAISPNFAQDRTIYASNDSYGYSVSRDGGATWLSHISLERWFPVATNPDGLSIALSPNYPTDGTIWVGTIGTGIFRSQDFGQTFEVVRTGYYAARADHVVTSMGYVNDHTVFALTLGGGLQGSYDSGQTWRTINNRLEQRLGFGLVSAVAASPNFANDHTIFAGRVDPYMVARTRDGGYTWERADAGIPNNEIVNLALSPAYPSDSTLYAANMGYGVFRSTNQGDQWTAINNGLSSLRTWHLALSPGFANDRTLFVATDGGGVFKSTNGGDSWQAVNNGLTSLSTRDVAVSPNYPVDQTVFVIASNGIFRSVNGGASWTLCISYSGLKALSVSPRYPEDGTVYAGGTAGVIRTTDGGTHWSNISAGMGHTSVTDLAVGLETVGHTVFASTPGGGVWQLTTGGAAPPPTSTRTASPPPGTATRTWTPTLTPGTPATATPTPTPSATPTATPTRVPAIASWRVNGGGPAYTDTAGNVWQADRAYTPGSFGYVGGNTYTVSEPIANTDDDTLFQSEHWGMSAYKFDVPNGQYRVDLLFDEIYDFQAGKRFFDVKIQGVTVLSNFCPFAAAGGRSIALIYTYQTSVSNGQLVIEFVPRVGAAKINAIAVEATTGSGSATPTPTQTTVATATATQPGATATATATRSAGQGAIDIAVNCGGTQYRALDGTLWLADRQYTSGGWGYLDGKDFTTNQPIAGTQDDTLYQSEHWGMTGYRFDLPVGTYNVQLKFAEIYYWARNLRVFDVQIEGQTVLSALDIFAVADRFTAYDRSFTVQVSDGSLDITFTPIKNPPKINAIRVTQVGP